MSDPRLSGGSDPNQAGVQPKDPSQPDGAQARWERVKTLVEAAVSLPQGDRTAFLKAQCGDDRELLEEVESLLKFHDEAGDFIESPPAEVHKFMNFGKSEDADTDVGRRMGNYQIVRELGRGGMGIVYLAERADEEFEKRVAIKVVRRGMESDLVLKRFRNERQILARLEHANIARLIDGGTTDEGLPYFIMEYVEGAPITEYCDGHKLPIRERIEIFLEACEAVQYAHERNIVHRDLKPTNILVKASGNPKLLDFGIAKWVDTTAGRSTSEHTVETTVVGVRMLTPAYASPEQLRGEALTPSSDAFSLGVILHELLCGRRPGGPNWAQRMWGQSTGSSTELPSGTIHKGIAEGERPATLPYDGEDLDPTPEQIADRRSTTPEGLSAELAGNLDRILLKAIRFNPGERYDSVEAFANDLRVHLGGGSVGAAISEKKSIVVLPFRVLSRDAETDDYLGLALADAVTTKLSNVPNLTVSPTSSALRAGSELNVDYALDGRIHKSGDRVRIAVQLLRMRDRSSVWAAQFDEPLDDLLKLEDSISGQVALALIPQLSGDVRREIGRHQTSNAKAYQAYLKGRWYWNQSTVESLAKALLCFMESVAHDPHYASAHVGVADYYIWLGVWGGLPPAESFAAAKSSAMKALEIDYGLADAHASLGFALWANDRDYAAAERELRLAVELNENCVNAHTWLALLYSSLGRHTEAGASIRRARALDSSSPSTAATEGYCRYQARNFDGALEAVRMVGYASSSDAPVCEVKAWSHLQKREWQESVLWARRAVDLSERSTNALCALACALAGSGNKEDARKICEELVASSSERWVSAYQIALVHHALGNTSACVDALERCVRERDWWVLWIGVDPTFDDMRADRRFGHVLRDIGLDRSLTEVPAHRSPSTVSPNSGSRERVLLVAAVVALVAIASYFLLRWFHPDEAPFENLRIAKLTTNGVANHAAISPDGKYVAYVSNEAGKPALWLRQVNASGSLKLPTPENADISRMAFSKDSLNLSFMSVPRNDPGHAILYQLPVPAGSLRAVLRDVTGPAALSPDGRQIVMIRADPNGRRDDMIIMPADGGSERVIASRMYPDRFSWPSTPVWSQDSKLILCGIEGTDAQGFSVALAVIGVADKSVRTFRNPRWQFLEQATWSGDGRGFIAIGRDAESSFQQMWYVPYPKGEPRRLTNDLSDYTGLTVTADSSAIVSVQMQTLTNVYVLKPGDPAHPVQITPGTGRYFDLSWSSRGEILYSSDASGTADIWIMNGDGSGQRQLTFGVGRNYAPTASPNGDSVVFHSNRSGSWNLWRMQPDGSAPKTLTTGTKDSNWPRFAPDGQTVIYHHTGENGMFNVFKVPASGGDPRQILDKLSMYPAVSPVTGRDGVRFACWYSEDVQTPRWRLAVFTLNGGAPVAEFEMPPTVYPDTAVRWTPDGRGITYIDNKGGMANLWVQPVDGGPRRALTNFTWGQIYSFDWSKDGRLAYSRGLSTTDVVIIRDLKGRE